MSELQNAVWITGASSGIGRAVAAEFARNGETVIATARRKNNIDSLIKEQSQSPGKILPYSVDITNIGEINKFYELISKTYSIRCLINNAGSTSFKNASDNTIEEIQNIIQTNLLGSIYAIKTVLPNMVTNKAGTIINMLSVVTKKIFTGSSAYSASKAGLKAYTDSLREEIRKSNIKIINISPGATQTPIWANNVLEKYSFRMMKPDDLAKFIYQLYSIKNNMVPEEIVIRPIQGDIE